MTNDYVNFFRQNENQQHNKTTQDEFAQNQNTHFKSSQNMSDQQETFKKLADYYNKNGEDKLIEDIFKTVKAQKANGSLTNEQLLKFAKSIYPMLNNSQREKIKQLLPKLLDE